MTYSAQFTGGAEGSGTLTDLGPDAAQQPTTDHREAAVEPEAWLDEGPLSFADWAARLRGPATGEDGLESWPPSGPVDVVIPEFEPLEGERLEKLASQRRGPLRWAAGLMLSIQAQREWPAGATPTPEPVPGDGSPALAGNASPGSALAEPAAGLLPVAGIPASRRRTERLRRSALRRGGSDLRPVALGVTDLTSELLSLVRDELAAATPPRGVPAVSADGPPPAATVLALDVPDGSDLFDEGYEADEIEAWLRLASAPPADVAEAARTSEQATTSDRGASDETATVDPPVQGRRRLRLRGRKRAEDAGAPSPTTVDPKTAGTGDGADAADGPVIAVAPEPTGATGELEPETETVVAEREPEPELALADEAGHTTADPIAAGVPTEAEPTVADRPAAEEEAPTPEPVAGRRARRSRPRRRPNPEVEVEAVAVVEDAPQTPAGPMAEATPVEAAVEAPAAAEPPADDGPTTTVVATGDADTPRTDAQTARDRLAAAARRATTAAAVPPAATGTKVRRQARPAVAATITPEPAVLDPAPLQEAVPDDDRPSVRPVAPISGWVGNEEDETAWQAWISDPMAYDSDGQWVTLGEDLAKPLPAPLRLAERWGGRRRKEDHPLLDD